MEKQIELLKEHFMYDDFVVGMEICESVDNGLEIYTNIAWGLGLTDAQYKEVENILDVLYEKGDYEIYFSFDTSGFDYWVNQMVEDNYLLIIIELKDTFDFDKVPTFEMDYIIEEVINKVYSAMN